MAVLEQIDNTSTLQSCRSDYKWFIRTNYNRILGADLEGFMLADSHILAADYDLSNDALAGSFSSIPAWPEWTTGMRPLIGTLPSGAHVLLLGSHAQFPELVEMESPIATSTPPLPDILLASDDRLTELASLGGNWDSYGAEPVSQTSIAKARALLESVRHSFWAFQQIRPYSVAPVADGGVQLEWRGSGGALEVEIGPHGELGYLLITGVEPDRTFEDVDDVAVHDVLRLLSRILLS